MIGEEEQKMSLTGSTNEEKIWNYLKAQGMTEAGIAGLMGNCALPEKTDSKNREKAE